MLEFFEDKNNVDISQRVFLFTEDSVTLGNAIITLDNSKIRIKQINRLESFNEQYYDFFVRALLGILRDFGAITIIADKQFSYLKSFGFEEINGELAITASKINLSGSCKKGKTLQ